MVKYLGSKRALVARIVAAAQALGARSAADLFAGTTRVGQGLREAGLRVLSNDTATYSEVFARAYVCAGEDVDRARLRATLARLAALPGRDGYVTRTFARDARYFTEANARRIDAIRDAIDALARDPVEHALLLAALLEAADRVDSTVGVQMAYLKAWAPRARGPLALREPRAVAGPPGEASREDANALAPRLAGYDLAYLDPPYNRHAYFSNYHVWETLVRWDAPAHYGKACKRVDCRTTISAYNRRALAPAALGDLLARVAAPYVVLSLSDEGFHDPAVVTHALASRGHVAAVAVDHDRYVGARIGIFNGRGERVGRVSHTRNREFLLVCGPDRARVDAAAEAACAAGPGAALASAA